MKLRYQILFLLLIILVMIPSQLLSQLYFKAKTIGTEEGLSDKRVSCFYKDSRGFMWIGTQNGLNRYDGHSFRIYRPEPGNSISNETINDIAEDSKGRIWVATMAGLNYYDPSSDHWENLVPHPDSMRVSIPNYIVWDIWFDKKGLLWIASDVFEFCTYDISTKKFDYYDWPKWARSQPALMSSGRYTSIHKFVQRDSHRFWLGTTKGLVSVDVATNKFTFIGAGYYGDVIDLHYDKENGKVFISTEKGRIFQYDENAGIYEEIFIKPESYPSSRYVLPGRDEIWLASRNGLVKISDDRKEMLLASHIPQLSGSLLPGGVKSVYEDDKGIRWVGTPNGISAFDRGALFSAFLPLISSFDKAGTNWMGGVFYDSLSRSYFTCSMDLSVVFIIDAVTGTIERVGTDANGKVFNGCNTIKADSKNQVWLLGGNHVYRYDRGSKKFHLFPTPNNEEDVNFRDVAIDADGNYWFAAFHKGIFFYDNKKQAFRPLLDTNFVHLNSISSLLSDPAHRQMLIGTFGSAIYSFNLDTREVITYYETQGAKDYAQLMLIHDIEMDALQRPWVATYAGGAYRYEHGRKFGETFRLFDMRSGLTSNNIISLTSDGRSTMWLLSGSGISAIDTSGKFLYDLKDGRTFSFASYSSDNMLAHDIYFNRDKNELLVGVAGGLLFYSPGSRDSTLRFPVVITAIKLRGALLSDIGMKAEAIRRIPFRSNTLSFEFAGLYYGNEPDIVYEYRLDGFDDEWLNAGRAYSAIYQNLPSGDYRFQVRARVRGNDIAGQASSFAFRVVPPFWETNWFRVLIGLVIVAIAWWFIYGLRQKLKGEKLLNSFATSLYGQHTVDDIFWDTSRNCIEKLGFVDCVIYQKDEERGVLVQRAAYGPKNPYRREILNRIEIPIGRGIVGSVAVTKKAEIIHNTSKDARYILDDEKRMSEITVPIIVDGKLFAVIDSEHPKKYFFNRHHLRLLKKIAAICSERISKYLAEEKLRTKIARDLHDEMGSTLTSINIISKVAMEVESQKDKVQGYLQKIKDHSGKMMESMSDIVWAINPTNDSLEKVILRMKEFAAEILEPARINYYFSEEGSLDKAQLNLEQRKDIYMVFKEAVNNAVKYSMATEVNIILQKKEDTLRMIVMDNGIGFNISKENSGNGLTNMRSRAKEMNATLKVDSIPGTGTTIILEVGIT